MVNGNPSVSSAKHSELVARRYAIPVVIVVESCLLLQWCKECVLWKGATEPGITTAAAPGTENAPDEIPDNTRTEVAASEIESVSPPHAFMGHP